MEISARLFYLLLSEKYQVESMGRHSRLKALSLPTFWEKNTVPKTGGLYVVRSQHLPKTCKTDCIYVCVGSRPIQSWKNWVGEVFYITDREVELFSLFNFLIGEFDRIRTWSEQMRGLLERHENVTEFVKCSLSLFENPITVTDYNLRVLSNCEIREVPGGKQITISNQFDRVPDEISQKFREEYKKNVQLREPFYYKGQRLNPEGDNYCINMYLGENYIGTCTLWDGLHPIQESDAVLFQEFASYIQKMLSVQSAFVPDQLVTMKSVFFDLLNSYPVSEENLRWALDLLFKNLELQGVSAGYWVCLVIRSANEGKMLPKEYLCTAIENMLPHTTVLDYEDDIVCYSVIPEGEDAESTVVDILLPYLKDMNFRVGVSSAFIDLFQARAYYLQARAILKTGYRMDKKHLAYCFDDYVLYYMLEHSLGEFDDSLIASIKIQELKNMGSTVDYWDTLRRYLDNECNASKTAQELYLHRSSLLPRLEKIRSVVDIDTPEQRLYLRMCMYLSDMLEKRKR